MRSYFLLCFWIVICSTLRSQDFSNYAFEHYHTDNSAIINDHIREIFIDKQGRVWVTSNELGLYLFNDKTKTLERKEFAKNRITTWLNDIEQMDDGRLIMSGYTGFLMIFDPKTELWDSIAMPLGEQPWRMSKNHKGVILFGPSISSPSLYQLKNNNITKIEDNEMGDVLGIDMMKSGDVLVSYRRGVKHYTMSINGTYSKEKSKIITTTGSYSAQMDKKGSIWIASYGEYSLFRSDKDGDLKKYDKLPEEVYFDYNGEWKYIIHCISFCPDNRVMLATQFGMHLAILNQNDTWETYSLDPKPSNSGTDGIERLVWDYRDSSLWIATWRNGLYHWVPKKNEKKEEQPQTLDTVIIQVKTGISYIPDRTRKARTVQVFKTTTAPAKLEIWDAQRVDGDTVSVYVNGKLVLDRYALTSEKLELDIVFKHGENEVLLYAHNLGKIPPNTMAMNLRFKEKLHRVTLRSDEDYCERVVVVFEE